MLMQSSLSVAWHRRHSTPALRHALGGHHGLPLRAGIDLPLTRHQH